MTTANTPSLAGKVAIVTGGGGGIGAGCVNLFAVAAAQSGLLR